MNKIIILEGRLILENFRMALKFLKIKLLKTEKGWDQLKGKSCLQQKMAAKN